MEYAINQAVPSWFPPNKTDRRQGTIYREADFVNFLKTFNSTESTESGGATTGGSGDGTEKTPVELTMEEIIKREERANEVSSAPPPLRLSFR